MTSLAVLKNNKESVHSLLNSEQLAKSANTNAVVVRRLICSLTRAGLIQTARGKTGGVSLLKEPHQITLKDIYLALELNDTISTNDKPAHKDCPVSCSMHQIMTTVSEGAEKVLHKYLESQKLSDLIKKIK